MTHDTLTPYERSTLDEDAIASPYRTPLSAVAALMARWSRPADDDEVDDDAPADGHASLRQTLGRVLVVLSHVAAKTVRQDRLAIHRRTSMRPMRSMADVARLDLWEVDEAAVFIGPKYMAVGGLLGLGAGRYGTRGMLVGAPVMATMAMRLIQEYAVRYGFDVSDPEERVFATRVFIAAVTPKALPRPHEASVDDLEPLTQAVSRLSGIAGVVDAVRGVAKRVLRTKAVRLAPAVAAVATAAFNVWLMRGVAKTAQLAYRERFLARKHHRSMDEICATAEEEDDGDDDAPKVTPRARGGAYPLAPSGKTAAAPRASARSDGAR